MKDSAKIKVRSNTTFVDTEKTEQVHWNKSNAVYDRSDEGPVLSEGALYSKYKVGLGFPPKSQANKQTNKTELKETHDKSSEGQRALQPKITTARANRKGVRAQGTHPRLTRDVPD